MKDIIASLQDLSAYSDNYLNYLVSLAKDTGHSLTLVHNYSNVETHLRPTAITGVGLMYPETMVIEKNRAKREEQLQELIKPYKEEYRYINYTIGSGSLPDKMNNEAKKLRSFIAAVQKTSSDSWLNTVFGTKETMLGKQVDLPCMYIPGDIEYKRPAKMLVIANGIKSSDETNLEILSNELALGVEIISDKSLDKQQTERLENKFKNRITFYKDDEHKINRRIIDELITQKNADILCFLNYNKTMLGRFFDVSTNKLVLESERPSIIF